MTELYYQLGLLFIYKSIDCVLTTLKSIYLYKGKNFISAIFNAIATFAYMTMMVQLVKINSPYGIWIITLATFTGSYSPAKLVDKFEKERIWVFDITPDDNERSKVFCDLIRSGDVPIQTYKSFNDNKELVLCCKIFSQSKSQSKQIEKLIPKGFKYHIIETKNYSEE